MLPANADETAEDLGVSVEMKLPRIPNSELKKLSHIANELGTVRRVGLTEQLIEKLESLVLKGVLSPGEQLPSERQLAHLLSVSRASLRQALKVLQVMGVLEVRHGSGNYLSEAAEEILRSRLAFWFRCRVSRRLNSSKFAAQWKRKQLPRLPNGPLRKIWKQCASNSMA